MAMNMDAMLRIAAKVQGLNEFKALSERLTDVQSSSQNSKTSFQQLTAESGRLAQETVRAAGSARAQSAALQDLAIKTRANTAEVKKGSGEIRTFGSVLQQLRGQSAGAVDGLGKSAGSAANNIRELQQSLAPTDQQLAKVREEIIALGAGSKQTERSLQQQIDVLKNLRSQAEVNGRLYRQLTADIDRLKGATQGLDAAGAKGAQGLQKVTAASKASTVAIESQIKMLARLQRSLTQGGEGYVAIGKQIDALKAKASSLDLSKVGMPGPGGVASGAVGAIRQIVDLRRELAKSNPGRVVLAGEGAAAAGLAGVTGAGVAAGLGGLGGGLSGIAGQLDVIANKAAALPGILKPLGGLLSSPAAAAGDAIANWGSSLSAAQVKLAALSAPFEGIATAIQTIGPGTAAAAGVASLAIASVYDVLKKKADEAQRDLEQSFRGITDEVQQTLQQMTRLFDQVPAARLAAQQELRQRNLARLGDAMPGSLDARRAANAVVAAEREIAKIQGQQNELLDAARSRESESARLQQQQRDIARQRLETQRKLTEQARKEREELQQSNAVAGAVRRNRERVAREQADLRRRAAEAFPRSSLLALPAAGGTTFQGAVDSRGFGGGARARVSSPEIPSQILLDSAGRQSIRGSTDVLGRSTNAVTEAIRNQRGALRDLFVEISKSEQASNGSINSLQRQRSAWQALQNAVNPAAPAYERARKNVQRLDEQIKQLTTTQEKAAVVQSRGIGREAVGSALGTLAMGGGLQGAAGALAGGLAFGGGVAGLAAGAGISAAVGAGTLAARVGVEAETAQVRLKALTEQFGEYNQAQAAAARIAKTLRISQTEATDSFSKLYAALRPTGVTLQEVEDAFIGFSAAARASGATATETSAALLQLKQALGSGVLQGDELRSIREQAPAAAQAIAREMGVTIGELKKLGSEGKITTDIVLRALARLKNENLDKLNAQFNTSAQALQDLRVATDEFGQAIARLTGPVVIQGLKVLTSTLRGAVNLLSEFNRGDNANQRAIAEATRQTQQRFPGQEGQLANTQRSRAFFNATRQRLAREFLQGQSDGSLPNASQLAEQQSAARERQLGRQRAAAGDASKQAKDEAKTASRMNELLRDNLRLNTELGNIGKDRLSQINAELSLIPQLLRLELNDLNTNLKGKELQQARINTLLDAKKRSAELEEELTSVRQEISGILGQASDLSAKILGGLQPQDSPLKQEIQRVKQEILDADRAAVDLLDRLSKLGGTDPSTGAARSALGGLRANLAAADPNAIASQRLVQGDVDALKQQITDLQSAGRELSTLEQLAIKYGNEWDKIDPKVRASLSALAQQKDELQRNVDKTREWNDVMNQAGTTISGVLTDLITGTDNWASSLNNALKSLASLLLQQSLMGLAGKDGRGFFSFLTGSLGGFGSPSSIVSGFDIPASQLPLGMAFANGGIMTPSGELPLNTYSRGGIANTPQLALFGEGRQNEAYVPLPDGRRIPVAMQGGGAGAAPITINVAVDAKGTKVEGDQTEATALARLISAAVQAEIIKQQRPGGRLANTR